MKLSCVILFIICTIFPGANCINKGVRNMKLSGVITIFPGHPCWLFVGMLGV